MHLLTFSQLCLLAFSFWNCQQPVSAYDPVCDATIYGRPDPLDCKRALQKIPYALNRQDDDITAPHFFVEPQQMPTPFSYVSNTYQPKRIVQLPRFWKHSMCIFSDLAVRQWADCISVDSCRVTLMTLGLSREPVAVRPVFTAAWKQVIDQAWQLRSCTSPRDPRGGYVYYECMMPIHSFIQSFAHPCLFF